ncbi:hypothetical protein EVAR_44543_1 [Eumeta japonica]|uniref:Uncharacterized protein n=1 Tax=Eumeta variegata TaxID=151549 RepID=A0A4C1XC22_EUMVA|nr:hypothetical protein EVAR_44543_1 [Eumeta japonica]
MFLSRTCVYLVSSPSFIRMHASPRALGHEGLYKRITRAVELYVTSFPSASAGGERNQPDVPREPYTALGRASASVARDAHTPPRVRRVAALTLSYVHCWDRVVRMREIRMARGTAFSVPTCFCINLRV